MIVGPSGRLTMNSTAVLVLSDGNAHDVVGTLFDIGFEPLVTASMEHALARLRRERFAAVFVDPRSVSIDALEFVLNARDIDPDVPVVVVGTPPDGSEHRILETQRKVHIVNASTAGPRDEIEELIQFFRTWH
jgi:hypothetical protein